MPKTAEQATEKPDVLEDLRGPDRLLCALRAMGFEVYDVVQTKDARTLAEILGYHGETGSQWLWTLRDEGTVQTLVLGEHAIRPEAADRLETLPAAGVEAARRRLVDVGLLDSE